MGDKKYAYAMKESSWYVYMIRCADDSLYTGVALDVHKRFVQHVQGIGAKYTRAKGAMSLVYRVVFFSKSQAFGVEWRIKHLTKAKKETIIKEQWDAARLLKFLHMPKADV